MGGFKEPLSTVLCDLIFMHLVLPHIRPWTVARQVGTVLWKRVSSYMFGDRYLAEGVVEGVLWLPVQERNRIK